MSYKESTQPFTIREARCKGIEDFPGFPDGPCIEINGERITWAESSLLYDAPISKIDHTHLRSRYHYAVIREDITKGPQAVAVGMCTDSRPVSEHNSSRAVPW